MNKILGDSMRAAICAVLTLQLIGCGTILYPERKGQRSGRIDVGVALLDGIGLFFFLIPGVIAYVVDFSNGTIYLPGTLGSVSEQKNLRMVKFDPKHTTLAGLEKIIKEQTGVAVKFDQTNLQVTQLKSNKDIKAQFAQIKPEFRDNRIASLR